MFILTMKLANYGHLIAIVQCYKIITNANMIGLRQGQSIELFMGRGAVATKEISLLSADDHHILITIKLCYFDFKIDLPNFNKVFILPLCQKSAVQYSELVWEICAMLNQSPRL